MSSDTFMGWVVDKPESYKQGKLEWKEFKPKEFKDDDVEIKITHCGICYSDVSTATAGWGEALFPLVVGHEIVGEVTKVGKNVKTHKIGQLVGIGAQSGSCLQCRSCTELEREPNCEGGLVGTYNSKYPDGSGKSYGGYADRWRGPAHFAIPIPDGLDPAIAAPLCCGGITAFAPLAENGVGSKGSKKVGIVGMGGIGHFGINFAKALGAEEIVVISRGDSKKADAMKCGATDFIATANDEKWYERYSKKLDFILITQNSPTMPLEQYVSCLRPFGKAVVIGVPEGGIKTVTPLPQLLFGNAFLGGSAIGGTKLIAQMLQLAADKKDQLNFMIEKRSMKDANKAILDMQANSARYRYTLVNDA